MRFRPLPWEYAVRNLFRRPLRSGLTFVGLTTVIVLVFFVVGFVRGLESSLARSGDERVGIVFSLGMGENLEYSSIEAKTADLLSASLQGIQQRYGRRYVSAELYLGTQMRVAGAQQPAMGLVRGVTPSALLVRRQVEIVAGRWPGPGEVMVGRLAAAKLGAGEGQLAVGRAVELEGRPWKISGTFSACGSTFESELWCRLDDLQQAMKRQDLSLVALTLAPGADSSEVELFCKGRTDLELQSLRETDYYDTLQKDYRPVRMLAWLVVVLVTAAGIFAGLNTMYGAAMGRVREFAMLQTVGFARRAIALSLVQEATLLSAAGSLVAAVVAFALVNGTAVRFTMGAFELRIDSLAVLFGCGTGLLLGFVGAVPPAVHAMRMPVVQGLKAI